MKGLYFAKPLEYRLEIPQEEFAQGDTVTGTLRVFNRGAVPATGLSLHLGLAFASFKALKSDGASALHSLAEQTLAAGFSLQPDGERKEAWEFALGPDFPIRSKDSGPFLLYGGPLDHPEQRGQIDLPVSLSAPLDAFAATVENHFSFEERGRKSVGEVVEVRFAPPDSYPTLVELLVRMRMTPEAVELAFLVRRKVFSGGQGGKVSTRKGSLDRSVPIAQFVQSNKMPNRALYREVIQEALAELAPSV